MRVLMISKACLTGTYQAKLTAIGQTPGVELAVMMPPFWADSAGRIELEKRYTAGYEMLVEPMRFNGNYHLHYWPTLRQRIAEFRPDIIHMDEEPYNLATWLAWRAAKRAGAKFLFFSWQNLYRDYPAPFRWMEQQVLKHSDFAIMGNRDAAQVFLQKGYVGPEAIIPQFGTDPAVFKPAKEFETQTGKPKSIGFAGRLIHGKGLDLLIKAVAQIGDQIDCVLRIAGEGPELSHLQKLAAELNLLGKIEFLPRMNSAEMPSFLQSLDLLVLPSRSLPNWKEQFGRVLIEAMACGVPVIGSDSGEIPNVIGDAGLIFSEGDVQALISQIKSLLNDGNQQVKLGKIGRERVLNNFTQDQVAAATVEVYRALF